MSEYAGKKLKEYVNSNKIIIENLSNFDTDNEKIKGIKINIESFGLSLGDLCEDKIIEVKRGVTTNADDILIIDEKKYKSLGFNSEKYLNFIKPCTSFGRNAKNNMYVIAIKKGILTEKQLIEDYRELYSYLIENKEKLDRRSCKCKYWEVTCSESVVDSKLKIGIELQFDDYLRTCLTSNYTTVGPDNVICSNDTELILCIYKLFQNKLWNNLMTKLYSSPYGTNGNWRRMKVFELKQCRIPNIDTIKSICSNDIKDKDIPRLFNISEEDIINILKD